MGKTPLVHSDLWQKLHRTSSHAREHQSAEVFREII